MKVGDKVRIVGESGGQANVVMGQLVHDYPHKIRLSVPEETAPELYEVVEDVLAIVLKEAQERFKHLLPWVTVERWER